MSSKEADLASEQCSAVVFYGISPGLAGVERFYKIVVDWFSALGHPPDRLSVHGRGHSGKLGSFARADAKLRKNGFDGVTYFEVVSSTPDAVTGHDYFLEAGCNCDPAEDAYADVVTRSSLATLSSTSLLPIARTVAEVLKPAYGIGYTREHELGPEFYALGICYGGENVTTGEAYEEERTISRWSNMGRVKQVWRDGVLRDVYPWNFLTKPQLARRIGAIPLEQWIQDGLGRGKVAHFCGDIWLWELKEYDILAVRATLRDAGAIFDWRKYVK